MIGSIDLNKKKVLIVGGGISGLVAAFYLDRSGYEVQLHEAGSRWGGLIQTGKSDFGIYESAAHSVLLTEPLVELSKELGVDWNPVRPESKARWILRNGKLSRFPLSTLEVVEALFRLFFFLGKKSIQTVDEFACRHLGHGIANYLVNPGLAGIFASSPKEITLQALMPQFKVPPTRSLFLHLLISKFSKHKKYKPKKYGMYAPDQGMESLVRALVQNLEKRMGDRMFLNSRISSNLFQAMGTEANRLLTIPANEAAALVENENPSLALALRKVRYAPLVSVTVWAKNNDFKTLPSGVGYLVPEKESRDPVLGILYNSSSFQGRVTDPRSISSFTVMLGGTRSPGAVDLSEEKILDLIKKEFKKNLAWNGTEMEYRITRWKSAIPIYNSELEKAWAEAKNDFCLGPGNILFGNYTGQVSIRGMIESAKNQWSVP